MESKNSAWLRLDRKKFNFGLAILPFFPLLQKTEKVRSCPPGGVRKSSNMDRKHVHAFAAQKNWKMRKSQSTRWSYCIITSPVGRLLLAGDAHNLKLISFQDGAHPIKPHSKWSYDKRPFANVIRQLKEYFAGRLKKFTLSLAPEGTPFQLEVWKALSTIPYGRTVSYGDIAKAVGKPAAARAVGAANGLNPLSIVVPCHRVIGSDGKLVGYGGGLKIKETLLALEQNDGLKKGRNQFQTK